MDGRQTVILLVTFASLCAAQDPTTTVGAVVQDVRIECNSNDIIVLINTRDAFNGMIYPKGLSKNSSCMAEYLSSEAPVRYKLPLRSCNTMSTEQDDGIEYFNTVVVQPHRKLVTNQGRGYHIRCKYQTREKTITSNFNVSGSFAEFRNPSDGSMIGTTPLTATAPMPGCTMKIFQGLPDDRLVAENVKIGDPLTLEIAIDNQDIYGMLVTDCLVRDGLGWGEQPLINKHGCPVDYEIMGPFDYNAGKTKAAVRFQAHKFPYTASVYYQCNVKLCIRNAGGCADVPPECDGHGNIVRRRRRRETVVEIEEEGALQELEDENLQIEVFSGLYVNEGDELPEVDAELPPRQTKVGDENTFCISPRDFAIGIAIAGLILMLAVIAAILILVSRRRRKKDSTTTGSSIYSGPYSNSAYTHSS